MPAHLVHMKVENVTHAYCGANDPGPAHVKHALFSFLKRFIISSHFSIWSCLLVKDATFSLSHFNIVVEFILVVVVVLLLLVPPPKATELLFFFVFLVFFVFFFFFETHETQRAREESNRERERESAFSLSLSERSQKTHFKDPKHIFFVFF